MNKYRTIFSRVLYVFTRPIVSLCWDYEIDLVEHTHDSNEKRKIEHFETIEDLLTFYFWHITCRLGKQKYISTVIMGIKIKMIQKHS